MLMLEASCRRVIERLEKHGFSAYAVGGCVRDMLMGIAPHDWDVCTSAEPEQIIHCFEDANVIKTGLQHGTVTVMMGKTPIEVTAFRTDGGYTDGRHPDHVTFVTSLELDLSRRDFTVNAMALSSSGNVIDLHNGQADLESRIIRCVGDADSRFTEDALRMLRAMRFAAVLGFDIEQETACSIHRLHHSLTRISAERIRTELSKLLCGSNARSVLLAFWDVLIFIIPELTHDRAERERLLEKMETLAPHLVMRLSSLLAGLSPSKAEQILRRLRYDTKSIDAVCRIIACDAVPFAPTRANVKRRLRDMSAPLFALWLEMRCPNEKAALRRLYEAILSSGECFCLSALAVNGETLLRLGFQPGRVIGETLEMLLDAVIEGTLPNEREALIRKARERL